uniref:DNA-directed RNA polymerase III subunit RPC9 n=1 Tax=Rhabditophanes sp. KR3021 TaxID=114890 RepID=A0AC35TQM9_9BILA
MDKKEVPYTYLESNRVITSAYKQISADTGDSQNRKQLSLLEKVLAYFADTPASVQNHQCLSELFTALGNYNLTDIEKVMIANIRPLTSIDSQVMIEEAVERLAEQDSEDIAMLSEQILPDFTAVSFLIQ